MRKTSFEYHIHGYRYAPESFHIYKGLPGQEKTELPLSDEQRYQMGYLYLTQGIKSAVDYVKHIERERERDRGVDNRPCYTARPLSQARSR